MKHNIADALSASSGFIGDHFSTIALLVGAGFALFRYTQNRQDTDARHDDERFVKISTMLGADSIQERMAGAAALRTFLSTKTKRFHSIVSDLSIAILRSRPSPFDHDQERDSFTLGCLEGWSEEKAYFQTLIPAYTQSIEWVRGDAGSTGLLFDSSLVRLDWLSLSECDLSMLTLLGRAQLKRGLHV